MVSQQLRRASTLAQPMKGRSPESSTSNQDAISALEHAEGTEGALPFLAEIEAALGADLGGVRAIFGATDALDAVGADGAAMGETVLFREASPSKELVAHEAVHVLQARNGGGGGGVAPRGGAAEVEADELAKKVVSGEGGEVRGGAEGAVALHGSRPPCLVSGTMVGHASAVWDSAGDPRTAGERNQALSVSRARSVATTFEQAFEHYRDQAHLGEARYNLRSRGLLSDARSKVSGEGSEQALEQTGDPGSDRADDRRVDTFIEIFQGVEQTRDQAREEVAEDTTGLWSNDWTINFTGGGSVSLLVGVKLLAGTLTNERTGYTCPITYSGFGVFFNPFAAKLDPMLGKLFERLKGQNISNNPVARAALERLEMMGFGKSISDSSARFQTGRSMRFEDFDGALASMGEAGASVGVGVSGAALVIPTAKAPPILMGGMTFGLPGIGVDLTGGVLNVDDAAKAGEATSEERVQSRAEELARVAQESAQFHFERGEGELDQQGINQMFGWVERVLYVSNPLDAPWFVGGDGYGR